MIYPIFVPIIFLVTSLSAMDTTKPTSTVLNYSKKIAIKSFNLLKNGCELLNPTPTQKKQMFSMLLMAGWFALAQATAQELPACVDILKGHVSYWNNQGYFINLDSYFDCAESNALSNNGCFDLCQQRHSDVLHYELSYPDNLYLAACYTPQMAKAFGNNSYNIIGTLQDDPDFQLVSYKSDSGHPLFTFARPIFGNHP